MFNIEDKETIMKLIDCRSNDEVIIPIYISIGNKKYLIVDMDEIDTCSPSIFKICFGTSDSVFVRKKFPKNRLFDFNDVKIFKIFDDDKQCLVEYITFDSSDIDDDNSDLSKEINNWYNSLLEYVMNRVEVNKKERIKRIMEELS
jgi:hypothetical protein